MLSQGEGAETGWQVCEFWCPLVGKESKPLDSQVAESQPCQVSCVVVAMRHVLNTCRHFYI